jgi:integrase
LDFLRPNSSTQNHGCSGKGDPALEQSRFATANKIERKALSQGTRSEEEKEDLMSETKRSRGTGYVFQPKNTRFLWIQYYVNGRRLRVSAGTEDRQKAEKLLRKKIGQVEAGVHRDTRKVTYEELKQAYYEDYSVNRRKSLRRDDEGNPRLDKVVRLDDFFSGYRAADIDADLIRKFSSEQQKKGLANGSINRSISALRRMFNLAVEDRRLRDIPHFPMLEEATPRQGFFECEQYEKLFNALPDYLRLPFSLAYFSGMRQGEILGLRWAQVDFLAGAIELLPDETKGNKARSIPIIPQLRTLLLEQHARRQAGCPHVCFRVDKKGNAIQVQGFRKAWYTACVKAGLGKMIPVQDDSGKPQLAASRGPRSKPKAKMTYSGMIFHDLRRSGVRNLVRAGVPDKVAMAISGHKTRSVFDRYNITDRKDLVDAGRKLADFHAENFGHSSAIVERVDDEDKSLIF